MSTARTRVRRRTVVASVAAAALPLVLLVGALVWHQLREAEERAAAARVTLARTAAAAAADFVAGHSSTLETLALTQAARDPASVADWSTLLRALLRANPTWDSIGLFAADGWDIASSLGPSHSINVASSGYFRRALASDGAVASVAADRPAGPPAVVVAVPVDFVDGRRGVLAIGLRADELAREIHGLPQDAGIEVQLVDRDGRFVVDSARGPADALPPVGGRPDVEAALAGGSGAASIAEPGQPPMLSAYAPVPGTGWAVLLLEPAADVLGPARRDAAALGGLTIVATSVAGVVTWLLSGRLVASYQLTVEAHSSTDAARRRAERSTARIARLQALTAALSAAPDRDAVVGAIARAGREALQGSSAALVLTSPEGGFDVVDPGGGDAAAPIDERRPAAAVAAGVDQAIRTGRPIVPIARSEAGGTPGGDGASADPVPLVVPLVVDTRAAGALVVRLADDRVLDDLDVDWLLAVGRLCGQALDRARLIEEARQATRSRDEFLAAASHDLRSPLTVVLGTAQLLRRRAAGGGAAEVGDLPDRIVAGAERLKAQIDELVDAARLRAGCVLELALSDVDLVELCRRTIAAQPDEVRSRLRPSLPDQPIVGRWDAVRLARVLDNLISNAAKYSDAGSPIVLTVVRAQRADRAEAVLAVRDRGLGIPAYELARVFEWHHRGANVVGRIPGSGIGLAGARATIDRHGGSIEVESEEGHGSTFTVRLPLLDPTEPGSRAGDSPVAVA